MTPGALDTPGSESNMKIVVSARREQGFRRAGKLWPSTPTEVDVDEKTLAVLKAEPQLVVLEPPKEGKGK